HPDRALDIALERFKGQRELLFAAQNVAAEVAVNPARLGQFQGPLAAIQQAHAQAAFHLLHVLASRRLANSTVLRAAAHAPGGRYLSEKSLFPEFHRDSIA